MTLDGDSARDRIAAEFLVQLVRTMRVAAVHELDNETMQQVVADLHAFLATHAPGSSALSMQCVDDNVYFNREFIKLPPTAFDAANHAKALFGRLAINEIAFSGVPESDELLAFFRHFQECHRSDAPEKFAEARFANIAVRPIQRTITVGVDRRLELARTYAQLVVLVGQTLERVRAGQAAPLARIRRATQQLASASEGQDALLVGLTRFDDGRGDFALQAVAVTALSLLMARRLGVRRADLMTIALAAMFADVGVDEVGIDAADRRRVLATLLALQASMRASASLERICVAYEHLLPAAGDGDGSIPSMMSRVIGIAHAFVRLTNPPPTIQAMPPDRAVRLLLDRVGTHFDRRVLDLFVAVVGLYPAGSLVRLSSGDRAIVLTVPDDPSKLARPTVKILGGAERIVELASAGVRIVESLDARAEGIGVTHYLLA